MRLQMILPKVEPEKIAPPAVCPYKDCQGIHFRLHQDVAKPVRDTVYEQVTAQRHECLWCRRTFRVYPAGVTPAHVPLRVKGLAVMLYLLGLSYGAASILLEALGVYLCKSRVYDAVQVAAQRVPGLKPRQVFEGIKTTALGCDLTSVNFNGQWLPLGMTVDDTTGWVLTIDELSGEDAHPLTEWIAPIAEQVGAKLLITYDVDSLKAVAEEVDLDQQICKSHVKRNTEALIADLRAILEHGSDTSLAALGVTAEQARADLDRIGHLMQTRLPEGLAELGTLQAHSPGRRRLRRATPPAKPIVCICRSWATGTSGRA